MSRKFGIGLLVLLIGITLSASRSVYWEGEGANGDVFWNQNEAFVFLNVVRHGYHYSYLNVLGEISMEVLGRVPTPNDDSWEVVVLRVTPDSIQTIQTQRLGLGPYVLFGESIYAKEANSETLWKWNGTRFERAPTQEGQEIRGKWGTQWDTTKAVGQPVRPDFDAVNGWSGRYDLVMRTLKIDFQGTTVVLIGKNLFPKESIQLVRDGRPPATIWEMGNRPTPISKRRYELLFSHLN
jgi:hypothetical protein